MQRKIKSLSIVQINVFNQKVEMEGGGTHKSGQFTREFKIMTSKMRRKANESRY